MREGPKDSPEKVVDEDDLHALKNALWATWARQMVVMHAAAAVQRKAVEVCGESVALRRSRS